MRYFVFFLTMLLGFASLTLMYDNMTYGAYVPIPPHDLLESSEVIFVGNITSANVTEILKSTGTNNPQNYSTSFDEYVVKVEEFLKSPLDLDEVTVISELGRSTGFDVGDRVLFYVKEQDGKLTYYHESFIIPKYCDSKSALEEPRVVDNPFVKTQESVQKQQDFTANIPIQFSYQKNMGVLSGKELDVQVAIVKDVGNTTETVFEQILHAKSQPCKWIASVDWEIIPDEGNYRISVGIKEKSDSSYSMITGPFYVTLDTIRNDLSPLGQFREGTPPDKVRCSEELVLVMKSSDGSPACVRPETKQKLIERGWATNNLVKEINNDPPPKHYTPEFDAEYAKAKAIYLQVRGPMDLPFTGLTIDVNDRDTILLGINSDKLTEEKDQAYYNALVDQLFKSVNADVLIVYKNITGIEFDQ